MKKILKYLSIFFGCFILLIVILFVIFIFYSLYEDDTLSDSNFSEEEIAISSDISKKGEIIDQMEKHISNKYNLPLYLQWVIIDISYSGGYIRKFMRCSFNTYKKESNEYGHIVASINLLDMNSFTLYGTFGDDMNVASLQGNKKIWCNLEELDNILDAASAKMKQKNKGKKKYEYSLEIDEKIELQKAGDKINYIYDSEHSIFRKE